MKNKQHGVALVEFALVLPLLLLLTFITTEFGRALYQYNILTKSVRDAARYLSTQTPGDTTKYSVAKNLAVYGIPNPSVDATPLAIGLTPKQVKDPEWQLAGASPVIRTVTITIGHGTVGSDTRYTFTPLFASVFGVNLGNGNTGITFAPISATMRAPL